MPVSSGQDCQERPTVSGDPLRSGEPETSASIRRSLRTITPGANDRRSFRSGAKQARSDSPASSCASISRRSPSGMCLPAACDLAQRTVSRGRHAMDVVPRSSYACGAVGVSACAVRILLEKIIELLAARLLPIGDPGIKFAHSSCFSAFAGSSRRGKNTSGLPVETGLPNRQ